ncbi:MAG TPA: Hpt domain-containing protein [Phycisphaerae bacterium]|nr:Hpt domain-containing protein [Phycisphaerae bacterium]
MSNEPNTPRDPIPSELVQEDESFAELVQEFIEGLKVRVGEISRAIETQDYVALRSLAHQLKGSAGGFGYPTITDQAAQLERHALGEEIEAIQADLRTLENMVARVVLRV